jgi:hypothetical protein
VGEQASRTFHVGGAHPSASALAPSEALPAYPDGAFTLRWPSSDPSLLVHLLADLYRAHVRATPSERGYDLTVSPAPVRVHHGATAVHALALDCEGGREGALEARALDGLSEGGLVILLGAAKGVLSRAAQGVVEGHGAIVRVASGHPIAATVGALLRTRPPAGLDRAQLLADAERSLRSATPPCEGAELRAALDALAAALDAG